jgi:hypothetical protein
MASDEDSDSPPINRLATGTSPTMTHTKSNTQVPPLPTIILMTSPQSSEKKRAADNRSELPHVSTRQRKTLRKCSISRLATRLRIRRLYYARL